MSEEETVAEEPERARFVCGGAFHDSPKCDYSSEVRWLGPCPGCLGYWNPVDTKRFIHSSKKERRATFASEVAPIKRIPTGNEPFDDVIGGGLVEGAVILLGGKRGAGKTTLLATIAFNFATATRRVLYASAEENQEEVLQVVQRIGAVNDNVALIGNAFDLDEIFRNALEVRPKLLIIDSLPAITEGSAIDANGESMRGRQVIREIVVFCQKTKIGAIVVNHVNRTNEFAGSEKVEHEVKAVLAFFPYLQRDDGRLLTVMSREDAILLANRQQDVRVLFGMSKNRIGPGDRKRFFEMTEAGLLRPIPKKPEDDEESEGKLSRVRELFKRT